MFTCQDSFQSLQPTCGWQYDSYGRKLAYSQGFCCACDAKSLTYNQKNLRAGSCSTVNVVASGTAHCMRFGTLQYSAYSFQTPYIEYTITVDIDIYDVEYQEYKTVRFTMDQARKKINFENQILITVVGVILTFSCLILSLIGFLACFNSISIPKQLTFDTFFSSRQFYSKRISLQYQALSHGR